MVAGSVLGHVSAEVAEYLQEFGMGARQGPLRAAGELVQGMLWTGSVQLTNAARLFTQRPRSLAHAVERLSRHLADPHWDHREWAAAILAAQVRELEEQSLIPIDATELAKPYAHHLQYQDTVRDASRVGDPLVHGYWVWGAYHWQPDLAVLDPLMLRPYSTHQPAFRSENDQWLRYAWALRQATSGRGIWLSDRGGDRPEILSAWLRIQPRWIIRLHENRKLLGPDGTPRPAGAWADWALSCRPPRGHAVTLPVRLPPQDVAQSPNAPPLWLVVPIYTFRRDGKPDRWILLTCGLLDHHVGPRQVRYDYAARWKSEDAKRFLGQVWHAERFLTRSFAALERMLWCLVLAGGFLARLQRQEPTLATQLQEEVLYWKKPVVIPAYRLAHGLQSLAWRSGHVALPNNA